MLSTVGSGSPFDTQSVAVEIPAVGGKFCSFQFISGCEVALRPFTIGLANCMAVWLPNLEADHEIAHLDAFGPRELRLIAGGHR